MCIRDRYTCEEQNVQGFYGEKIEVNKDQTVLYYNNETFEALGKALLISILDLFETNPCSRLTNSTYQNLDNLRFDLAKNVAKVKRFRKEPKIGLKTMQINQLIPRIFIAPPTPKPNRQVNCLCIRLKGQCRRLVLIRHKNLDC
eukprot:TRINITY_DN26347_c0_g1_i1.p1 TRINITY_DN26347_c0_g1~~TRINITY_DN26347_c0_g1_i1.p1  ORF type:complete len:163 (+),score=25.12 TRINITY_DN26347_c0_g1_i1:59-490(+)